ncbi:MAG: hypothetical protein KGN16_17620 [Burkholderiales bacterium]|nr:hypothetical protein [Burkholderiales bacterium]
MAIAHFFGRKLIVAVVLGLSGIAAQAQRAALVQEIYGPGRSPYQSMQLYNQTAAICPNNYYCQIVFPQVPAGKRLVVAYASASYSVGPGQYPADVSIGTDLSNMVDLPTPILSYPGSYTAAAPVTIYFEPGSTPSIFIGASGGIMTGYTGRAAIVGYLVPAP